jgi:hypothetical protein
VATRAAVSRSPVRVSGFEHVLVDSTPLATSLPLPWPVGSSPSQHDRIRIQESGGGLRATHIYIPSTQTPIRSYLSVYVVPSVHSARIRTRLIRYGHPLTRGRSFSAEHGLFEHRDPCGRASTVLPTTRQRHASRHVTISLAFRPAQQQQQPLASCMAGERE